MHTATYSPDDNKLRLYPVSRLDAETYARVKAAGFKWAPQQQIFIAPMWTPGREDVLLELCGEIEDEDKSLADRAKDRAERFEDYSDKRANDAERAKNTVSAITDNIPFGQPILVGHHSEKHARKDAEKIENGMRKAVKMWETSQYWTGRAAAAISHAKYKERPDVRARRIKGLEADLRKMDKADKEGASNLMLWDAVDMPEKWKARADGTMFSREERAACIAGRVNSYVNRKHSAGHYWSAYDVLRLPAEDRYSGVPEMSIDEVLSDIRESYAKAAEYRNRWRMHYNNRLTYERAMLADAGGTVADQVKPEVGGAVRCLWSPRGGWAYIQKVNKVTITIFHCWNDGGRVFRHNEPLDKLRAIMSKAQVDQARADGRLTEIDERGFYLEEHINPEEPKAESKPQAAQESNAFTAMKEQLKAGVQVVTAPQLFPTPRELAQRVADIADVRPGHNVLEPSAGTGALLGALGGRMFGHNPESGCVHAVEINRELAGRLQAEFPLTNVHCNDFLSNVPADFVKFDRIVMNPPFENGADIKHIMHARSMLAPGGRLVAICANGPRQQSALKPIAEESGGYYEPLPAGSFAVSGTSVNTAVVVIEA